MSAAMLNSVVVTVLIFFGLLIVAQTNEPLDPCNKGRYCDINTTVADSTDCKKFYLCDNGYWALMECGEGTNFDLIQLECLPDGNCALPCPTFTESMSSASYVTVQPGPCDDTLPCEEGAVQPDQADCTLSWLCNGGMFLIRPCAPGTVFDIDKNECTYPYADFNCEYRCKTPAPSTAEWTTAQHTETQTSISNLISTISAVDPSTTGKDMTTAASTATLETFSRGDLTTTPGTEAATTATTITTTTTKTKTTTRKATTSDPCNRPTVCSFSWANVSNPDDCQKYYQCGADETWQPRSCPDNLRFDNKTLHCTEPQLATCQRCPSLVSAATADNSETTAGQFTSQPPTAATIEPAGTSVLADSSTEAASVTTTEMERFSLSTESDTETDLSVTLSIVFTQITATEIEKSSEFTIIEELQSTLMDLSTVSIATTATKLNRISLSTDNAMTSLSTAVTSYTTNIMEETVESTEMDATTSLSTAVTSYTTNIMEETVESTEMDATTSTAITSTTRSTATTRAPIDPCNRPTQCFPSGVRTSNPDNCTTYYICDTRLEWVLSQCPEGTWFDKNDLNCVAFSDATCQPPCLDNNITTPLSPGLCDNVCPLCERTERQPDRSSCNYYYQCRNGAYVRTQCSPPVFVYNIDKEECQALDVTFDCYYRCRTPEPTLDPEQCNITTTMTTMITTTTTAATLTTPTTNNVGVTSDAFPTTETTSDYDVTSETVAQETSPTKTTTTATTIALTTSTKPTDATTASNVSTTEDSPSTADGSSLSATAIALIATGSAVVVVGLTLAAVFVGVNVAKAGALTTTAQATDGTVAAGDGIPPPPTVIDGNKSDSAIDMSLSKSDAGSSETPIGNLYSEMPPSPATIETATTDVVVELEQVEITTTAVAAPPRSTNEVENLSIDVVSDDVTTRSSDDNSSQYIEPPPDYPQEPEGDVRAIIEPEPDYESADPIEPEPDYQSADLSEPEPDYDEIGLNRQQEPPIDYDVVLEVEHLYSEPTADYF